MSVLTEINPLIEFDKKIIAAGYSTVCATDEAGRGPLAGPVSAAAVILDYNNLPDGINDSKALTEAQRDKLYDEITASAVAWSVSLVDNNKIDDINILEASMLAMRNAVATLLKEGYKPDIALVDGNRDPKLGFKTMAIVSGDARSIAIAAASIIAKVTRDRYMLALDKKYPQYGFGRHKGYPTRAHYEAIDKYGITPEHRKSFLKDILSGEGLSKVALGRLCEQFAAKTLQEQGYEILARNFCVKGGEIDIIAANSEIIAFVEVKMRGKKSLGSPIEAVTQTKRKRILKTAQAYLMQNPADLQPRFDVFEIVADKTAVIEHRFVTNAFDADSCR